jgi:hypothetical protein
VPFNVYCTTIPLPTHIAASDAERAVAELQRPHRLRVAEDHPYDLLVAFPITSLQPLSVLCPRPPEKLID